MSGEAVTALTTSGAYAEVVLAPATLTLGIGSMPLRTAAGLGWGAPTAYDLINTAAHVRPGESVLIHAAAGSVGTLAAQFARLAGAGRIVGVVSTTDRADYAAQFGYDQLLLREEFPAKLDGEKPDVILDPVGGSTRTAGLEPRQDGKGSPRTRERPHMTPHQRWAAALAAAQPAVPHTATPIASSSEGLSELTT
ncbi:zinc-binding dehydrogenase [Streptomyces lunaelactis]|uniref:zinc-binding dehydrogenase n=1 Tax=Streptomyces lunaelactis TaxID=1535768 RepID=UPI0028156CAA|nr:zinc-binding dehydrogenase [Streptomyces lunaelactis]